MMTRLKVVLLLVLILYLFTSSSAKRERSSRLAKGVKSGGGFKSTLKEKSSQRTSRKYIIRCCGKASCLSNLVKKTKNVTHAIEPSMTKMNAAPTAATTKVENKPEVKPADPPPPAPPKNEPATQSPDAKPAAPEPAPPAVDAIATQATPAAPAEQAPAPANPDQPPPKPDPVVPETATAGPVQTNPPTAAGQNIAETTPAIAATSETAKPVVAISSTQAASTAKIVDTSLTSGGATAVSTSAATGGAATTTVSTPPTTTTSTTVTTSTTTTPSTTTIDPFRILHTCSSDCAKNTSLFETNGQLKDPDDYGSWRVACNQLYLFGKSVVDWDTNTKKCCSLGMTPIMIPNDTIRNCLNDVAKPTSWIYNANYWTSGRKVRANNSFQWCLTDKTFSNVGSSWAPGQPDNINDTEHCVHLKVNKTAARVDLTDKKCGSLFILGCQGPTTPPPPCYKPVCPSIACNKNAANFYYLPDQTTQILTNPAFHGIWKTVNGRSYMFSAYQTTWDKAQEWCCGIGMKLLSIEYQYEYANLIASMNIAPVGEYWTSGSDVGCEGSFGWCASNKLIRQSEAKWAPQEPNNLQPGENCVTVTVTKTSALLKDTGCARTLNYICEARDTSNSSSSSEAMIDECGAAFNVSRAEAENVFNTTSFSVKMKCFLKCMGENGGFMLNGKLVDSNILQMAELVSTDTKTLQDNMVAVSTCGSQKGMDECDTASQVYQCGQEKAPDLVANIITSVETNNSVESVPLPPKSPKCVTDYSCVVDPARRNEYDNNLPTSLGMFFTACGIKYFVSNAMITYKEAASMCCSYGLKIASLKSIDEVACIVNSPTYPTSCRTDYIWVAASRLGFSSYGWCTASYPFNLGTLPEVDAFRSAYPDYFLLAIKFGTSMAAGEANWARTLHTWALKVVCKP